MNTIADIFNIQQTSLTKTRDFLCGVEYEIEDIIDVKKLVDFTMDIDPSLRNNGREFKTIPASYTKSIELFDLLHSSIKHGKAPYTDRTSIHVHVNMTSLTAFEVRQFVLTYALFEPFFFEYVGPVRQGSIFCVPLSYTYLPSIYKTDIKEMHKNWQKYAAFNLSPLGSGKDGCEPLGTIEFRHMYGTGDREKFITWLSAIKELYTFIEETLDFSIIKMIEQGHSPEELLHKIIPTFYSLYGNRANLLCKNSLLDVKLSTGGLVK